MARYNEILVGRINRGLQKYFGIKGDAPVPQLAGDVGIAHALFNGAENRYLEGWNRYGTVLAAGAPGAGNRIGLRIRNPLTSNVIAVMEKMAYANTAAAVDGPFITLQTTNVDLNVAAGAPRSMDKRYSGNSSMVTSVQNNAAADANTIWQAQMPANTMVEAIWFENQELPLLPGDAYSMYSGVLNQGGQITFFWRERFLEESERS
jgi:hypothetical protein